MAALAQDIVSDPRWFPLRFDPQAGNYHFAFIPAELHRNIAFLEDVKPEDQEIRVVARSEVAGASLPNAPLRLIMHSGLGGSTFVARALAQPGVAVALLEPPILSDVIAFGLRSSSEQMAELLDEVTRLLARPFSDREPVVCKVSGVGNGLAPLMAALNPQSLMLCLDNPLETMLAAFAVRGIGGRVAARHLMIGLRNSRMFAFRMTEQQLLEHSDFQVAALAWLSIQKMMAAAQQELEPSRAASIGTAPILEDAAAAIAAIASHFRLELDARQADASGSLSRHSKSGEPFDPEERAERIAKALRVHADEIDPLVSWARRIAETSGIPWRLSNPLIAD